MESNIIKQQTIYESFLEEFDKTKRNVKTEAKTFKCDHCDYTDDS